MSILPDDAPVNSRRAGGTVARLQTCSSLGFAVGDCAERRRPACCVAPEGCRKAQPVQCMQDGSLMAAGMRGADGRETIKFCCLFVDRAEVPLGELIRTSASNHA